MAINFTLPASKDRGPHPVPLCAGSLVVIGANGSGKSRFTSSLAKSLDNKAYCISALNALYIKGEVALSSSIGALYRSSGTEHGADSELEMLVTLLMKEEIDNLLAYKMSRASGNNKVQLKPTRLDSLITLWHDVYPYSKMMVDKQSLKFGRENDNDTYSLSRLSDGERAVLYLIGSMLYAPRNSVVIADNPEMFLHPTLMQSLWNRLEQLRPDCTMVYTTHDLEFASSRTMAATVWVKNYDPAANRWDYSVIPPGSPLGDEMYMELMGVRKPVLFIEGDGVHSIDGRLYPLIFRDYTVKSLGSCNKVIEATRTFNDLNSFHNMVSLGIVDRDRRDQGEVSYLKRKNILVPDVAEIENILLLEEVIRAVASASKCDENHVATQVKQTIIRMFASEYRQQALMHTRHRVKRTVEYRIDGRFNSIDQLEEHITTLVDEIAPRQMYNALVKEFKSYIDNGDYHSVLRVFNRKTMLQGSNVAQLVGLKNKDAYIRLILKLLHENGVAARRIRKAIHSCFGLDK